MSELWIVGLLASTLRVSTPLLFAAMGGFFSERSGVVNIALEGVMLMGAFAAGAAAYYAQSPWLGMVAAIVTGVLMAVLYGILVIEFKADQIVAGTALNLFAGGMSIFLTKVFFESTGATPALPIEDRFQSAPIWMAWGLVVAIVVWMRVSASALWLQFAGESPDSLEAAGINVRKVRWSANLVSGALAGLGGASLSIFLASSFSRNLTAGRGFMAVAALIFGKWRPIPTAIACIFFGLADALQIQLQGVVLWGTEPVPVQFIQILPYAVTILVLAGVVGRSRAPTALGRPLSILLLAGASLLLSSCEFTDRLKEEIKSVEVVFTGGRSPLAKKKDQSNSSPQSEQTPDLIQSEKAKAARIHAELLREMIQVVFNSPLNAHQSESRSWFGSLADSMNQGATFEGIYNGLTHSSNYRQLEENHKGSTPDAVSFFARELALLQAELPEITRFTAKSAKPLETLMAPTGAEPNVPVPVEPSPVAGNTLKASGALEKLTEQYKALFSNASIYTLKRVLGDELLKVITAKRALDNGDEALAAWYAQWATRLSQPLNEPLPGKKIDLGLSLRSRPDEKFHADWARTSLKKDDQLVWEALNRVHRILNALNEKGSK